MWNLLQDAHSKSQSGGTDSALNTLCVQAIKMYIGPFGNVLMLPEF